MFETERLILRPFAERDIDLVLNLWNDPDVQRGATNEYLLPRSPAFKEKLREWADKALFYVIITLKTNGEFLGNVTLDVSSPKDRDGTLSITLSKKYWGNGYGREILKFTLDYAFKSLGLHRVSLEVIESNVRAVKLYTTIGFKEEGRLRKGVWIDGAWEDTILMGILEEEWLEPRTSTVIPVVKWSKSSKAEGCYVNGNQNLTRSMTVSNGECWPTMWNGFQHSLH